MTMARGSHLFPSRTQKLSLFAPMVLPGFPVGEWVVAGIPRGFGVASGGHPPLRRHAAGQWAICPGAAARSGLTAAAIAVNHSNQ